MDIKDLIQDYLQTAKLMQLATVHDDRPWVCNVWFVTDKDWNIYYLSSKERRHSHEIEENHHVAGAIALPQSPHQKPRGLQFEGLASMLTDTHEIETIISLYAGRIFSEERTRQFLQQESHRHYFYKIVPSQFVLFDGQHFPDEPRQAIHI